MEPSHAVSDPCDLFLTSFLYQKKALGPGGFSYYRRRDYQKGWRGSMLPAFAGVVFVAVLVVECGGGKGVERGRFEKLGGRGDVVLMVGV